MKLFQNFDPVGFLSNILAVILGIIITFSIQEVINSKDEKENVKSALDLVRDELTSCVNDIQTYSDQLEVRSAGARYVLRHKDTLTKCPPDSIQKYGMLVLYGKMEMTLPDDAMQLLKSSSLFQSIEDNKLAMDIIGAYDRCHFLLQLLNKNEDDLHSLRREYINRHLDNFLKNEGTLYLSNMATDPTGYYFLLNLSAQTIKPYWNFVDDIKAVISDIDSYLSE